MTDFSENAHPKVQLLEVDDDRAGQRIDNFLLFFLKGVPKSMIYRLLRTGQIRVNKGRIKPVYRIQSGDIIRIPPVRMAEKGDVVDPGQAIIELIEKNIIFEDSGLIVLNKPAGLAVHGGSGISFGVIEAMRKLKAECKNLELVHRLDKDTSGCLLIAKKRSALRHLHSAMRSGDVKKFYQTLCRGKWRGGSQLIDAPLRKNVVSSGERIVRVSADGKEATSRFTPKQRFKIATLMEVELFTGRTHQIRVHADHCGHPVAGDEKYGDKDFNRQMREYGLKRMFLHAWRLNFPWDEGVLEITAPLDEILTTILKKLA